MRYYFGLSDIKFCIFHPQTPIRDHTDRRDDICQRKVEFSSAQGFSFRLFQRICLWIATDYSSNVFCHEVWCNSWVIKGRKVWKANKIFFSRSFHYLGITWQNHFQIIFIVFIIIIYCVFINMSHLATAQQSVNQNEGALYRVNRCLHNNQ